MDRQSKTLKHRAPRKQLLMANSVAAEGPWCSVQLVKQIEVICEEEDNLVVIEVEDPTRLSDPINYTIKGCSYKPVNVPRGKMRVIRIKGKRPITVYAHCAK